MGNIIYHYGVERFGVQLRRSGEATTVPAKSRRQQEIEILVKERRQLRKQWKKASDAEREGLQLLQGESKSRLATLRNAENLRKLRKKEHTRTQFFKNPFKFVKDLFPPEKSGTPKATRQEVEEYMEKVHQDTKRHEQLTIPYDIPPIQPPEVNLETGPPKWKEVEETIRQASLYGKGVLELPITSLTEEYKCSKVRLQMTLKDSTSGNWTEVGTS
ncbi:hypothetical protein D4764_01G0016050 [Takifugu flavidus]|uniref:Uncharacterized protein n=1 Tax=Takifugu flavidus TaxID=433684 RepID=A0A5C6PTN2_9TELE|nr:hypothetical protein D4764_01G0016050 [Takifugu flavidus]